MNKNYLSQHSLLQSSSLVSQYINSKGSGKICTTVSLYSLFKFPELLGSLYLISATFKMYEVVCLFKQSFLSAGYWTSALLLETTFFFFPPLRKCIINETQHLFWESEATLNIYYINVYLQTANINTAILGISCNLGGIQYHVYFGTLGNEDKKLFGI